MFDVVQRPDESIREFVERFNREAVNASDLTDDIRMMAFVKALLPNSRLAFELSRKNSTSVEEMYSIAYEHMIAQELLSPTLARVQSIEGSILDKETLNHGSQTKESLEE